MTSRRAFIGLMVVLTLVPLVTGLVELAFGTTLLAPGLDLAQPAHRVLDSNLRFFGGVWFGLGVWMVASLWRLEERLATIRWVWLVIFLGGVGRVLAMAVVGLPPAPFVFFTALELVGGPVFIWWASRLEAHRAPALLSAGARL